MDQCHSPQHGAAIQFTRWASADKKQLRGHVGLSEREHAHRIQSIVESEVQWRSFELLLMRPGETAGETAGESHRNDKRRIGFSTNEVLRDGVGPEIPVAALAALARLWRGTFMYSNLVGTWV